MKKKRRVIFAWMLTVLMSVLAFLPMKAEAGKSDITLDKTMLTDSEWSNPEGDVVVSEEGTLTFPQSSTEYTRFIMKSKVKADTRFDALVNVSASMKFTKIPSGKSFILAFGLGNIEALPGEAKNVEVSFTNKGGIQVGITAYDENGTAHTVANQKASGISINNVATVAVEIRTDKKITVSVNGTAVCSGTLPVTGEGRVGFLQTGNCGVEINNLVIKHYEYATPENPNINEDFEQGGIDLSKLATRAVDMYGIYPRGQSVEQYNGNYVLMFRNVQNAYICTAYKYSNFEMTFDVPYMDVITEYDQNGNCSRRGQTNLYVSIGGEQAEYSTGAWKSAVDTIVYNTKNVHSFNNKNEINAELTKDPWAENGRPFSVKVSVVDSVVTAGIKWMEEKEYQTVLTYQLKSGTPTGHVQIWIPTNGNCAIDNIKVTNLDKDAQLIETEFKNGKLVIPEDPGYQPMERVYADSVEESSGKVNEEKEPLSKTWMLIPVSAMVGGIALGVTAILTRNKKKKEGTENEQ